MKKTMNRPMIKTLGLCLGREMTAKQIAGHMNVTPATVKKYTSMFYPAPKADELVDGDPKPKKRATTKVKDDDK